MKTIRGLPEHSLCRETVRKVCRCLDIETTGLSCEYSGITVIGIYLVNGIDNRLVQLVGMDVTVKTTPEHRVWLNV